MMMLLNQPVNGSDFSWLAHNSKDAWWSNKKWSSSYSCEKPTDLKRNSSSEIEIDSFLNSLPTLFFFLGFFFFSLILFFSLWLFFFSVYWTLKRQFDSFKNQDKKNTGKKISNGVQFKYIKCSVILWNGFDIKRRKNTIWIEKCLHYEW